MIHTAIASTGAATSREAGAALGAQLATALGGASPDVVILFASTRYDAEPLLNELGNRVQPRHLVGSSSAGEFTNGISGEGLACAMALRSDDLALASGVCSGIGSDRVAAAHELARQFHGLGVHPFPYRSALLLTDALAGSVDDFVEQLTHATSGKYQFFGGGAGDDGNFQRTQVFCGDRAYSDAAVGLEILSKKPLGIGVGHGWTPGSSGMRVTEADGRILRGLNGYVAADAFTDHARATDQQFDRDDPLRYFLHNILGIETPHGYRLRVPIGVQDDGSIVCAAEVPVGAKVHIMSTTTSSGLEAAARATREAVAKLEGHLPQAALFFDCVATRLRSRDEFDRELDELGRLLGPDAGYLGCNTHGQIARAAGQFGGFHNCTAVVCVLPR
jgi:hypothetical protein